MKLPVALVVAVVAALAACPQGSRAGAVPGTGVTGVPAPASTPSLSQSLGDVSIREEAEPTSNNLVTKDTLSTLAPAVLKVLKECLAKEYSAMACWKLFVVRKVDTFIGDVRDTETSHGLAAVELYPGVVALEKDARRQDGDLYDDDLGLEAKEDGAELELDPGRDQESLDRALLSRTTKLFNGRHLSVRVLPGVALTVSPRVAKDQHSVDADVSVEVGPGFSVGRMKMKNMSPIFLLPPLMFMGMLPFMLATLKGMVIKAMMLNQLAFTSTLWLTIRDVVFGPRPIVKYYNYGYKHPRPHPPVHYRHPPPPPPQHASFEHFDEHQSLDDSPSPSGSHGASPFFHDESSSGGDDAHTVSNFNSAFQPQDYSSHDSYDSDDHHSGISKSGEAPDDEIEESMPPHASPYVRLPPQQQQQQQQHQQQQQQHLHQLQQRERPHRPVYGRVYK